MKELNIQKNYYGLLNRLGINMIVIGGSLILYYLGFFGQVEGPLNPSSLGQSLADLNITKFHVFIAFIVLTVITISWNWVYNIICHLNGWRLTCNGKNEEGELCHSIVKRTKSIDKKTGAKMYQYICTKGHTRLEAHFHPVQKGTFANTVSAIMVVCCIIIWYAIYYQ
ncbi:MAG: hypothetical protein HQK79_13565 [Desulfobacterales bacterium]|nr:hypothetical protein [Desulfobacterales bacterium]MBF0397375.1 hypothetical protein [Desulfobacterales bacterium]